jgi:hypothetical protein
MNVHLFLLIVVSIYSDNVIDYAEKCCYNKYD